MKQMHQNASSRRKNERGSILAFATISMLALILAVGLGVDISRLYTAKGELQNSADAAALAAVSALNSSSAGITEATNRAVQAMNKYDFNNTSVSFPRSPMSSASLGLRCKDQSSRP